jgi:four helix bundle protein
MLDYKRLDAYRCALELAKLTRQIVEAMPRGDADLADQFVRACRSIGLNIAEGSGKTSRRDRARFNAIARGSAMECGGILDQLEVSGLVEPALCSKAQELVERLVAMLSKMAR